MPNIDTIVAQMTLEEKAALCTGASPWTTTPVERLGVPEMFVPMGRTGCAACPMSHAMGAAQPAGHLFPDRLLPGVHLGSSICCSEMGQALGEGGHCPGRGCAARPGRQHEAHAAVRAQLRVLLRRPLPGRRAGGQLHQRRAEQGRGHVAQALRRQQPGDPSASVIDASRRRAHPARDLPAGLRDGGQEGASPGR